MEYFLTGICSARERPIRHLRLDECCIPCTLLALYGMLRPPSQKQAEFMVTVVLSLVPCESALLVARLALRRTSQYLAQAAGRFDELRAGEDGTWISHVAGRGDFEPLVGLLRNHWKTFGGHWLLCEYPQDESHRRSIVQAVLDRDESTTRVHGRLLAWASVAGVTFDDNLLDMLTRREPAEVDQIVQAAARQAEVTASRQA